MTNFSLRARAIYPGTFDIFTVAHAAIVRTAQEIFDLTIAVGDNPQKKTWFTAEEREEMIRNVYPTGAVAVCGLDGRTLPDAAAEWGVTHIVRGVRNTMDWEYETRLFRLYKKLNPSLVPVYIPALPEDGADLISSSLIKDSILVPGIKPHLYKFIPMVNVDFVWNRYCERQTANQR